MSIQRPESYTSKEAGESVIRDSKSNPQLIVTNILTSAIELARKGDLIQAEKLLETLSDHDNSRIEVIDLLAKIYAQQGRTDQAQGLWLKALQRDPSNLRFLSALRMCAYCKKSRFEHFILQHSWLLIVIILWFTVAMIFVVGTTR